LGKNAFKRAGNNGGEMRKRIDCTRFVTPKAPPMVFNYMFPERLTARRVELHRQNLGWEEIMNVDKKERRREGGGPCRIVSFLCSIHQVSQ
jgi:hypothetical protein